MTTTGHEPTIATSDHVDPDAVEAFAAQVFGYYTGGMLTFMIDIGQRTGLFAALAHNPATSDELAGRTGLDARYVREWLGALTTGGVLTYEPADATYALSPAHAVCLTGGGAEDLAPVRRLATHLAKHVDAVTDAFRLGGGVAYEHYRPEFTDVMDGISRGKFDELLLSDWLPLAPGLSDRLAAGARVADIGCGTGHALVLMAQAYPDSTFVGYDIAADALAAGRAEARTVGIDNVRFEQRDVAELTVDEPFDAVVVFDAIHDQVAPATVLRRMHDALTPGGQLFMVDINAASDIADNLAHPLAPFLYATSVLHCMTISLAHDGAGLGTVWGRQLAQQMLTDAGFTDIADHDAPGDPFNAIYTARRR
jgi:SAM-dependent methyltransferase